MVISLSGQRAPSKPRLITRLVLSLDGRLRQAEHIFEYSSDRECLFRIERTLAARSFVLLDGTVVAAGDPLVQLHFWNEHIFARRARAEAFSWGKRMRRAFVNSLIELSDYLDGRGEYDGVPVVVGDLGLAMAQRNEQLLRVCRVHGFEPVRDGHQASTAEHLHRAGQNVLALLLTLAVNPRSARLDVLARTHTRVAISRAELTRRYGGQPFRGR